MMPSSEVTRSCALARTWASLCTASTVVSPTVRVTCNGSPRRLRAEPVARRGQVRGVGVADGQLGVGAGEVLELERRHREAAVEAPVEDDRDLGRVLAERVELALADRVREPEAAHDAHQHQQGEGEPDEREGEPFAHL